MTAWLWWPLTLAGLFLLVWGLNRLLDFMFPTTRITPTRREYVELDNYRRTREALGRNSSRRRYTTNGGNEQ